MAEVNGKLVTCDRCGKQIFLKTIGDEERDGGFTRWNKFEPFPEGWETVGIPTHHLCKKHRYIRVCPDCFEQWVNILSDHYLKATEYIEEVEDGKND